ncbi:putative signal transducing protein [Anaerobacillus isosaccharinicus]|uniref:DUF2007 domain-containing protein n=1 Tax=Anaerobacillus isosaccharinicus TaxID=1532552 RepID=A0A1S2ME22_9BACI|nr:DUF2007 domain-containing protein [Anaerobacillus isosaccharinicus]MBA5588812.1 DUF2007 domain-containing protein [Anaerobacillus isosaccharinicus]QOY37795.1 DUF2007 domain-containing protein [Anaerobacillus isosaccharinicus]
MYEIWFVLVIVFFGIAIFFKIKNTINKERWIVLAHSDVTKINIYKLQNLLTNNGIKSRVEFDDARTNHAVRGYYIGNKGSIRKLMVQEKDLANAKPLLEENK